MTQPVALRNFQGHVSITLQAVLVAVVL